MQVFFPRWVKATTAASRLKSTMLQISEQPAPHSWWIEKDKKQVTAVSKPTHWKWNRACSLVTRPRTWRSPSFQCHKCHACDAKRMWMSPSPTPCHACHATGGWMSWMSPSPTPATQLERRCHQAPRLPRKVPQRHRRPVGPKRATGSSPVP